jgi:hypothetical protein
MNTLAGPREPRTDAIDDGRREAVGLAQLLSG